MSEVDQVTDEPKVDQITSVPKDNGADETRRVSAKVKDPKRVAAGKALAEKNRKAREALKKQEEEAANRKRSDSPDPTGTVGDNIVKAAALVGAGFTLYHGYSVIKPYLYPKKKETLRVPSEEENKVVENRIEPERLVEMDME